MVEFIKVYTVYEWAHKCGKKINGTKRRNLISKKDQGSRNIEAEKLIPKELKCDNEHWTISHNKEVAEIQEEI